MNSFLSAGGHALNRFLCLQVMVKEGLGVYKYIGKTSLSFENLPIVSERIFCIEKSELLCFSQILRTLMNL